MSFSRFKPFYARFVSREFRRERRVRTRRPITVMITCLGVTAGLLLVAPPPALAAAPDAPPVNFTATRAVYPDGDDLYWTDASTNEKYFQVETKAGADKPWVVTWKTYIPTAPRTGKVYFHQIRGLPWGKVFCYRVSAVNDEGRKTTGEKCDAPVRPANPSNLTLYEIWDTNGQFWFENSPLWEWTYKLYSRRAGSADWVLNQETPPQRPNYGPNVGKLLVRAFNLIPERYYCFKVTASNSRGESGASNEVCATTKIRRPNAPTDLRARSDSPTTVTLTWSDVSATEIKYELIPANSSHPVIRSWGPLSGTTTTTISGLTPNTEYGYRLRVTNAGGSSYSNAVKVRTQSLPDPPQEVQQGYQMVPYIPYEGLIFWRLNWNPNAVPAGTYMKAIKFVGTSDRTMFVMKHGKPYNQCGSPDASIPLESGQNATPDQLSFLYGSTRPKPPLLIEACASSHSGKTLPIGNITLVVTFVMP